MANFNSGLVLLLAGLASSGCYAHAGARGYVVAESAPAYVETYPSYYYEGRTVYLVDGRWYTRDHGRWMYYRSEPRELYRYRTRVEVAPAAPRYERRVEVAPPAPRYERRAAPPPRRYEPAPPPRGIEPHRAPPPRRHHDDDHR
ncbi:MAG: hypothetical protein QM756_08225 [Polyangiaceae bacterium]